MLDAPLERLRGLTVAHLGQHFARGDLSTRTFEARLELAFGAESSRQLRETLWDLARAQIPRVDGVRTPDGYLETSADRASWLLGRGSHCDAQFGWSAVSRVYARLFKRGSCWSIADLDSTNGTWINGRRVTQARLRPGDDVRLGTAPAALAVTGWRPWWLIRPY